MYNYYFSAAGNSKTGLPTTTTSKNSCPISCELKGKGCYAEAGRLNMHWQRLSNSEATAQNSIDSLIDKIKTHFKGIKDKRLRLNQAGDLPHNNEIIDKKAVNKLIRFFNSAKILAYTYTHHNIEIIENLKTIKDALKHGLVINYSAKSEGHALELFHDKKTKGIPLCTLINPENHGKKAYTIKQGDKKALVIRCPAEYVTFNDNTKLQCKHCNLCMRKNRNFIVGFTAHGVRKNKINASLLNLDLIKAVNI